MRTTIACMLTSSQRLRHQGCGGKATGSPIQLGGASEVDGAQSKKQVKPAPCSKVVFIITSLQAGKGCGVLSFKPNIFLIYINTCSLGFLAEHGSLRDGTG